MKKSLTTLIILLFAFNTFAASWPIEPEPGDTNEVAKAKSLHKQVVEEGRIIKSLEEAIAITLPQGISKKIGNQDNIIVLETISFSPTGAKLTAYMVSDVPRSEEKIALKGKDINFAPGGFTSGARLELIEDVDVKLGENMTMVIKGNAGLSKTFVEWDCNGYKSMGLQGEIQFSREKLLPVDANGKVIPSPTVKVTAPFETQLVGWDDLLLELGISPFKVKDVNDFSFSVNSAVFDFSEVANSSSMVFPEAYESSDFTDGDQKMWKGFFLKDLVVTYSGMNDSASTGNNQQQSPPPSIQAHNLLIDNLGLSGRFSGNNLITLDKGSIGSWPFSLDEISAEISKNQLANCGFKGRITVPPLSDTATLNYEAFIDPGNQYSFIVSTQDTLRMDMMMAKLRLDPNSSIDISVIDGKFKPKAILNGNLTIKAQETDLAGIDFEELEITPEAPYIKVKAFSFGTDNSNQKLGKYPIAITNIGMVTEQDRTGLRFDLMLNLVGEGAGGFAGETGLTVYGKQLLENNRKKWKFDGVEINRISIDIDGGSFKLDGSAEWYKDDPTYGNGFSGSLEAKFSPLPKIAATALFGNINGMRYFYADALVTLHTPILIFTGVYLYTFGGGIYHHMRQLGWDENPTGTIGKTASGIIYKPDEQTFIGLKATVGLGGQKIETYNADVTFEIAFNNNAGVDRIIFRGNGYFMTPPEASNVATKVKGKCNELSNGKDPNTADKKDTNPSKNALYAFINLDFDFRNDVMHGNLGVYINLPGGVLTGIGPGGKAGEAVMHFAPNEWYIYIGTPDDRIGVRALNFAELNAYFMMGTQIPASPPPPPRVSEILGGINLDYMGDLNALGQGRGIAFGAGLSISTGNLAFEPFYAQFDAGAGFDVMLKNYGNVSCAGQSEPLGINGWYANGQVWAYIEGAIGIRVDWRFIHGNYEILSVGAAAILQAKLPNPFWMRGIVGGRYSILGGMISGSCRFDFTIGEECEIIGGGSPVQGIEVISELTPNDGSTDVNVFNAAQAVFNMPIDKVFELQDMNGNNVSFKILLDHFQVKDGSNILIGDLEWNTEKDVLAFNSFEILPPQKLLSLDVQVSFMEMKNGSWQILMDNGQKVIESLKTTFTTGTAPDYIPISNVLYSYPLPMMFNYYQNETDIGYIQLDRGQDYLFHPGAEWNQIGRFADKQGNKYEFNFNYITAEKKVSFKRPANLKNNAIYSFELVNVPAGPKSEVDKNIVAKLNVKRIVAEDQEYQEDANVSTIEIKTKDAEGDLTVLNEKNIFETHFRTSKFNTLSEKINNLQLSVGSKYPISTGVHLLLKGIYGGEVFDNYETGKNNVQALIKFENILDNGPWYQSLIYPYLYENYPLAGNIQLERDVDPIGIPPINTIVLHQYYTSKILTDDNIKYDYANSEINAGSFYSYLIYDVHNDYINLATKVCSIYYENSDISSALKYLIITPFPQVRSGDYKFKAIYLLPGINIQTSWKVLNHKVN